MELLAGWVAVLVLLSWETGPYSGCCGGVGWLWRGQGWEGTSTWMG